MTRQAHYDIAVNALTLFQTMLTCRTMSTSPLLCKHSERSLSLLDRVLNRILKGKEILNLELGLFNSSIWAVKTAQS